MSEQGTLESLQALYTDLLALSESRLLNLDRLGAQLDAHIQDFRKLLDKKARSDQSRQKLATGKLEVSGDEYAINNEFQQGSLQLADDLDLDEVNAAKIFLEAQRNSDASERPVLTEAIIRFHQRRKYLLDCVLLVFQLSVDVDQDEPVRQELQQFVNHIIRPEGNGPTYVQKCLSTMVDIKGWLQKVADKVTGASVLGQRQQPELLETLGYERVSLVKQHESLGVIVLFLVKGDHSKVADFELLLNILKRADKYDNLLVHYFPALSANITRFGSIEGGGTVAEARALNDRIFDQPDQNQWNLVYVQAAVRAWWLAEYSSWYGENHDGSLSETQLDTETKQRSKQFAEALKDGAFDFILSLSADVKSAEWNDPARHGLRQWLQRKSPVLIADSVLFSDSFQEFLMEQLETFIESFVTNLPDILRKLRVDEDEQRQLSKEHEHDLDLERFIVIISYAFENRPKAAQEGFWDVPDSALSGFMHWASRRASTPLVSAFCEMLQALSDGDICATGAHEFLLDDGPQSSGKMRRTHSLTWNQIFKELTFFSSKIRDHPALPQPQTYRTGKPHSDLAEAEPESFLMLECYLRLISRLCAESEAARSYLAHHPSFHIVDLLFQLASSAIAPRLRACAFTTLRSLLSQKTRDAGEHLWNTLDFWISGGYSPGSSMSKAPSTPISSSQSAMNAILGGLASGFEEPNAFVQLLHALVLPYEDESGLHDSLPFPEQLGGTTRMAGIDPYVDFAVGQIFAARSPELADVVQVRLLQLSCLDFIATCLDTFNEDLVVFASQSNVWVDTAIAASSLRNYVLLHPFSRVMEWMFNDKVMDALFAAIHQDPTDVASAAPDSPLILCLLRGIHVITSILELQPTYLNIIRPIIKTQSTQRKVQVSNAAFGSFEDGVLNHLFIIPDLGHHCGTGHPELVIASLKLLQKLSSSPKLSSAPSIGLGRGNTRNKALAALDDDAETISKIMLREMESDIDVNQGPESSAYIIKTQILDFLISCLRASPSRPTIAHRLLGFECSSNSLNVDASGSFSQGVSLFHTILAMVIVDAPLGDESSILSWLVSLNYKGQQVLKELWSSPLSSSLSMTEMRSSDSLFMMFIREVPIQPGMLWDGSEITDPTFPLTTSSSCLTEFLCRRTLMLQYLSAELRHIAKNHSPSLKQRILETFLGSTTVEKGQQLDHITIFDLFDFMEPAYNPPTKPVLNSWLKDLDFLACQDDTADSLSTYDLEKVEELLILRRAELLNSNRLQSPQELAQVNAQAQELIDFYAWDNRITLLCESRLEVLRAWVQLTLVMIQTGDFDSTTKTSFVLRTLQTVMPRLERDMENIPQAMELAKLAKALLFGLDFASESFKQGDMGELVSDRLFHLFQISLRAISFLGAQSSLKEIFYNISYQYLAGMSDVTSLSGIHKRHSVQTIKSAGERFIDIVCDDAHAGEPTCRIAALLLLSELVKMGKNENSRYIIEALIRLNFIGILVDSVQTIPAELRETSVNNVDMQLSYCHSRLTLLLNISQTRFGASAVLVAGLFHSIRVSSLFAIDPDLGVDIDGPDSISKHYDLLAAVMRVICAALLSRGTQNEQSLEQGRRFLTENRLPILAVLKRSAGLGDGAQVSEESTGDLAESFMLLISVSGFLELENEVNQKKQTLRAFT